jgi:hypothetical protein
MTQLLFLSTFSHVQSNARVQAPVLAIPGNLSG